MPAIAVFVLVFAIFWWAGRRTDPQQTGGLMVLVWVVLFVVFAGNRFNGSDWINYKIVFENLSGSRGIIDGISESPFEWLYSLLMWILGQIGLPYQSTVIATALINVAALMALLRSIAPHHPAKIVAFIFLVEGWMLYHEQLRQSLGISLVILSLLAYLNERRISALLLWILAIGCHTSAAIAPLLLFLVERIRRNDNLPITVPMAALFGVGLFLAVSTALEVVRLGILPSILTQRIGLKLELYDEHPVFGASVFTAGMIAYGIGFLLLLSIRDEVRRRQEFWFSLAWSAALLWAVLGPLLRTQSILLRFEHYLLIFLPVAMGLALRSDRNITPAIQGWLAPLFIVFAFTFPLRTFLHPEHLVWTLDYENAIIQPLLGIELEDEDVRRALICANLLFFENDFCPRYAFN